jgi:hypothetical protein
MAEGRQPSVRERDGNGGARELARNDSARKRARGHSAPEVNVRLIVAAGSVLAAVLAAILGGVFALHAWRAGTADDRFGPAVSAQAAQAFPEPRLQPQSAEERTRYLAEQRSKAAGYGWIDRSRGIVRIPVERAMRLLVREHASPQQRGDEQR